MEYVYGQMQLKKKNTGFIREADNKRTFLFEEFLIWTTYYYKWNDYFLNFLKDGIKLVPFLKHRIEIRKTLIHYIQRISWDTGSHT